VKTPQRRESWDFRLGIVFKNLVIGNFSINARGGIANRQITEFIPHVYFAKAPNLLNSDSTKIADNQYVLAYQINKENILGWYIGTESRYNFNKKMGINLKAIYEKYSRLNVLSVGLGLFIKL
jgi:hypothetical protein